MRVGLHAAIKRSLQSPGAEHVQVSVYQFLAAAMFSVASHAVWKPSNPATAAVSRRCQACWKARQERECSATPRPHVIARRRSRRGNPVPSPHYFPPHWHTNNAKSQTSGLPRRLRLLAMTVGGESGERLPKSLIKHQECSVHTNRRGRRGGQGRD